MPGPAGQDPDAEGGRASLACYALAWLATLLVGPALAVVLAAMGGAEGVFAPDVAASIYAAAFVVWGAPVSVAGWMIWPLARHFIKVTNAYTPRPAAVRCVAFGCAAGLALGVVAGLPALAFGFGRGVSHVGLTALAGLATGLLWSGVHAGLMLGLRGR